MAFPFSFRENYKCFNEKQWIDAGENPVVRHEGVAARNNVIKHATHRATVFVGPTLKSLFLFYFYLAKITFTLMERR